jgi:Flp pilus assembly pilin Flp
MVAMRKFLQKLRRNEKGITSVEFALVVTPFMMMVIGSFDLGYQLYARSLLQGAIEKAARDSALESGNASLAAIDSKVSNIVGKVVTLGGNNSIVYVRRSYINLSDIGDMEDFTDSDNDGKCDLSEPFEDVNANNTWDERGTSGLGGARAAVLYTATLHYRRIFPAVGLLGLSDYVDMTATSVLRNQPFNETALVSNPVQRTCPATDV